MKTKIELIAVCAALSAAACGHPSGHSAEGAPDAGAPAPAPSPPPALRAPAPAGGASVGPPVPGAACLFSADCALGEHCDLGQCSSDCSAGSPCRAGEACSARGRCLAPGAPDVDPPPITARAGTIHVDRRSVALTDHDERLLIRLTSDTDQPVRYRVEVHAPYLSLDAPRGEFTTETLLALRVDGSHHEGTDLDGSVHVFTTLGDVIVSAPMTVGLGGVYQGVFTYDATGAGVPFGSTQVVVEMLEENGDVKVRIDPRRSLLFPDADGQAMAGRGSFTLSDGVELSLKQVLPAGFGGAEDPFQRAIGRDLRVRLAPSDRGTLEGTFEETVHGLFEQPVTLSGSVFLERRPLETVSPRTADPPPSPVMPAGADLAVPGVASVFAGWNDAAALASFTGVTECAGPLDCDPRDAGCGPRLLACAGGFDRKYHQPLTDALSGNLSPTSEDPVGALVDTCREEIASITAAAPRCASIPPLASVLAFLERSGLAGPDADARFGEVFAHTLDPALFVAQEEAVQALRISFVEGFGAEAGRLAAARSALAPSLRWVLHPRFLERLRRSSPPPAGDGAAAGAVLSARTLARTFHLLSTVGGESSRLAAADRAGDRDALVKEAQAGAVTTLLEVATLGGIIQGWSAAPPDLGTEFVDVLTPLDEGFQTLLEGALVFGVPEGYIPFVYEPGRKPTNFEQMMDALEAPFDRARADEEAFRAEKREFEQSEESLRVELEGVRGGVEQQITDLCGDGFDVAHPDWDQCGAGDTGDVARRRLDIRLANERLLAAQSRVQGMRDRIAIAEDRVNRIKGIREGTVSFTAENGDKLVALTWAEASINAMEKFVEIASNANAWNAGAPIAEGAVAAGLELEKGALNAERDRVHTAQEIRIQEDNARVELLNGLAEIKGLMIDVAQLELETHQDVIGVLQAELDARSGVTRARQLQTQRDRTLARIQANPLRDPSYRLLATRNALLAMRSRADLQKWLYLAGRALEYHVNRPFDEELGKAVLNAFDVQEASRLKDCLSTIFSENALAVGTQNPYTTEVSLRRLLGIRGSIRDEVTGEELDEAEQFRRVLLRNQDLDGEGGVAVDFSSNLDPGNGLWASTRCDDRITGVEAQIVGDFLGDNEAEVDLTLDGGGVLRRCDTDRLVSWSTSRQASLQAGVNSYGTAPAPNASLHGLSVASARYRVTIPGPSSAPSNADLDLHAIEDVVLRVHHEARAIVGSSAPVSVRCLSDIGAGR